MDDIVAPSTLLAAGYYLCRPAGWPFLSTYRTQWLVYMDLPPLSPTPPPPPSPKKNNNNFQMDFLPKWASYHWFA